MNKPINLKPLSKKHCEWIMFNHFKDYFRDKYSDKKKYPAFDLELVNNMSFEDLNLKIIEVPIEGDNLEGLIKNGSKHKSKDNVVRFIIDYQNPFSKKEHSSLNVLAKTSKPYLPDRKENIRNEKESLKLCNDVYPLGLRKIGKEVDEGLVKFVPQYYAYDNELSVLFREYLDAKNLTKVMLEAQNEWNNENVEILCVGDFNLEPFNISKSFLEILSITFFKS